MELALVEIARILGLRKTSRVDVTDGEIRVVQEKLLNSGGRPARLLLGGRVGLEDMVDALSCVFGKWGIFSCLTEGSVCEIGRGKLLRTCVRTRIRIGGVGIHLSSYDT